MESKLDRNKQNAIAFYKTAFNGEPAKACARFVGDEYIQHNPLVGDGIKSFNSYFEKMPKEYPNKSIEFTRSIAEGDLVALHTHQIWPGGDEYVTMDFLDLIKTARQLNTRMLSKIFLKNLKTTIQCINRT